MADDIVLDRQSFKALAVDTRVDIMKLLGTRRHTQSELAAALSLSVPTVKQHLDALSHASLVERQDEGRKWVYYALSKKGKAVLNPDEKKFWILLSVFVLTAASAATGFVRSRFANLYAPTSQFAQVSGERAMETLAASAPADAASAGAMMKAAEPIAIAQQSVGEPSLPWGWIILGIVFVVELGLVGYYYSRSRRNKKLLQS